MKLQGRTILITGGSAGIGLELAARLLALGNSVAITGRDPAALDAAVRRHPGLRAYRSDVADARAIAALHARVTSELPALDILVNNAGIMRRLDLHAHDGNLEDLTREIDINLSGAIRMTQQFLPQLKAQPHAAIVNVTSGLAFVPMPLSPIYSATKAALHSYSQSLRVQLASTRVQVFEVAPPAVDTALNRPFADDIDGTPLMSLDRLGAAVIQGLARDRLEIRPGLANVIQIMSRVAPGFMLRQLSKSAERALAAGATPAAPGLPAPR